MDWEVHFGDPEKKITQAAAPACVATLIEWAGREAGLPILTFGGQIYVYKDTHYDGENLSEVVYAALKRIGIPLAFVNDSEFIKKVDKNLQLASSKHRRNIEMNPRGINFADGTLMITAKDTKFVSHSSNRVFTYCLPFNYNGDRKESRVWKPFIEQIIPNEEYRTYTLASLANAVAGDPLYAQRMLLLMGVGASGKSTLLKAISDAVGANNVSNVDDLKNLTKDESRFRIDLANHILCICGDASGNIGNKDVLKQIISKEEMAGRRLYKEVEYFTPRASLIVASNEMGFTHELADSGIARRLDIIEFREAIPEGQRDPNINQKLASAVEQREMIIDMIDALISMQNNHGGKMVRPEQLVKLLDKLKTDGDNYLSFLNESGLEPAIEPGKGTIWVQQSTLRDLYVAYRVTNGSGKITTSSIKQKARDHGSLEEKGRSNGHKYLYRVFDRKAFDDAHSHIFNPNK